MELLNSPNSEYLLDASLETLHAQSLEWLDEIDFWVGEMFLFYGLVKARKVGKSFPDKEDAGIEKQLVIIRGEMLDRLRSELRNHERQLYFLYKSGSTPEDRNYRHVHRRLSAEFYGVQFLMKNLKKKVFALAGKSQEYI